MSTKDFHAEIVDRLRNSGATRAQVAMALAVLQQIRWYSIGPQLDLCSRTGKEIGDELGIRSQDFSPCLALLENVGAITRFADGREKIICLSPEYAEAEASRNRFRQITLPLFTNFSVGSISGDDSTGFLGVELCPKTLNAGKSGPIIMSFTADSNVTKTHAANLVIADNASGSPYDSNERDGDQSGGVSKRIEPQFRQSENRNDQRRETSDAQEHRHRQRSR